jgi:hypothetical protein
MPEWLEQELTRHLAPVEAPPALTWRPPAPKRRLEPILALAATIALVFLATAPSPSSPAEVNRYLQREAGIQLAIPANTSARLERADVNGGIASVTYRVGGAEARVLIARASLVSGPSWKPHGNYVISGSCGLCHL